jgi:hypothetical protein
MAQKTSQGGGSAASAPSGHPRRPPPTNLPSTRIASGHSMAIRFFGGANVAHSGVQGAPRQCDRFVGLQHHRELGKIEATDKDQRSGPELGSVSASMHEGIAYLAQSHHAKRGRQIERPGPECLTARVPFERHYDPDSTSRLTITILAKQAVASPRALDDNSER